MDSNGLANYDASDLLIDVVEGCDYTVTVEAAGVDLIRVDALGVDVEVFDVAGDDVTAVDAAPIAVRRFPSASRACWIRPSSL